MLHSKLGVRSARSAMFDLICFTFSLMTDEATVGSDFEHEPCARDDVPAVVSDAVSAIDDTLGELVRMQGVLSIILFEVLRLSSMCSFDTLRSFWRNSFCFRPCTIRSTSFPSSTAPTDGRPAVKWDASRCFDAAGAAVADSFTIIFVVGEKENSNANVTVTSGWRVECLYRTELGDERVPSACLLVGPFTRKPDNRSPDFFVVVRQKLLS